MLLKPFYRGAYVGLSLIWDITKPVVVGVRVLLVENQSVVLVKHVYQPEWFLPGGRIERGETPEQAAQREIKEELGITLGNLKLLGVFTNNDNGKTDYIFTFVCTDFELNFKTDYEIEQARVFPISDLPRDASSGCQQRIQSYINQQANLPKINTQNGFQTGVFQEIIKVEREWVKAHQQLDTQVLEKIMAEEYTVIWSDGTVVGKQTDLATYQSGNRRWDLANSDQYNIRVYGGNTAILIGRWQGKGTNTGENFDYTARFTSVYVKQNGEWKMVHAQATPMIS